MTNEEIEIKLLLEGIFLKYGYDFRNYTKDSINSRINQRLMLNNLPNISVMQYEILNNLKFFETLLQDFSIQVTEMFRDPSFYKAMREQVFPILKTYPHIGCIFKIKIVLNFITRHFICVFKSSQKCITTINIQTKHFTKPVLQGRSKCHH